MTPVQTAKAELWSAIEALTGVEEFENGVAYGLARGRVGRAIGRLIRCAATRPYEWRPASVLANEALQATVATGATDRHLRWHDVLRRDPCAYCGTRGPMTIDHIHPKSQGAPNKAGYHNAAPACEACNSRKGGSMLLDFLAGGGMRSNAPIPGPEPLDPDGLLRAIRECGGTARSRELAERVGSNPYVTGMSMKRLERQGAVRRTNTRWILTEQCRR